MCRLTAGKPASRHVASLQKHQSRDMDLLYGLLLFLSSVDEKALLLVNGLHSPFFDGVMWTVSDKTVWQPLYIFLAVAVCRRHSRRDAVICLLVVGAAIAATDQTCGSLLRPLFGRLRPSNPDNSVAAFVHIVNNYRGGNYGFPSCHAANSFCLAVYLSLCFRGKRAAVLLFTWAALVSYSRVYLGVHYPGDVIGGMFVGSVYAVVFFYIYVVAVSESKPAVQAARLMFYNVSRRFGHLQVFAEVLICYVRKSFRVKRLR